MSDFVKKNNMQLQYFLLFYNVDRFFFYFPLFSTTGKYLESFCCSSMFYAIQTIFMNNIRIFMICNSCSQGLSDTAKSENSKRVRMRHT